MKKTPETSKIEEKYQDVGRWGRTWKKIKNVAAATAVCVASALGSGACVEDKSTDPNAGVERCFDPDEVQRYPFNQNIAIALAIHIVLNSDGSSDMDIDSIKENIDDLRRVYNGVILNFYVTSIKFPNSSLQPGMVPGETRGDYEQRLKDYIKQYGTKDAVDVIYTPGWFGKNGSYIPAEGEEFIVLYTDDEGRTVVKKTLSHEMGHLLGLKHPFEGDDISDTPNYSEDCPNGQYHTYLEYDQDADEYVCKSICTLDGSLDLVVNLMNYDACYGDLGQLIQTKEGLTYIQLAVANCVIQSAKGHYINSGLPEITF